MAKATILALALHAATALSSPLVKRQSGSPAPASAPAAQPAVASTPATVQNDPAPSASPPQVTAGTFLAGDSTYTAIQQDGGIIIGCTFLSTSAALTVSGQTISLTSTSLLQIADGNTYNILLTATAATIPACVSTDTITFTPTPSSAPQIQASAPPPQNAQSSSPPPAASAAPVPQPSISVSHHIENAQVVSNNLVSSNPSIPSASAKPHDAQAVSSNGFPSNPSSAGASINTHSAQAASNRPASSNPASISAPHNSGNTPIISNSAALAKPSSLSASLHLQDAGISPSGSAPPASASSGFPDSDVSNSSSAPSASASSQLQVSGAPISSSSISGSASSQFQGSSALASASALSASASSRLLGSSAPISSSAPSISASSLLQGSSVQISSSAASASASLSLQGSLSSSAASGIPTPHLHEGSTNNTLNFNETRKAVKPTRSGAYLTVSCSDPALVNAVDNQDPTTAAARWQAAKADEAWADLVKNWNAYLASGPAASWTFSLYAHDFFNVQDHTDCGEPVGPCPDVLCQDANSPGGWLIINSLSNIWQGYNTFNVALLGSGQRVTNQLSQFQTEFLPIPKSGDLTLDIILSVIGVCASLLSAGFWNWAKPALTASDTAVVKGGADFYKDATNAVINNWNTDAYRFFSQHPEDPSVVIETYADIESHISDGSLAGSNQTLKALMTGTVASDVTNLGGIIANGAMLAANPNLESELNGVADQVLWGGLMRYRWHSEGPDEAPYAPYVLYVPKSVYNCGSDPSTAAPIPGDQYSLSSLISGSDMVNGGPMWCDFDGNSWFLLNALGTTCEGGNNNNLNGASWGGITLREITQSAWNGYVNNNQQNPFDLNGGPDYIDAWGSLDGSSFAPGFFNFPVCSSVDAIVNAQSDAEGSTDNLPSGFPCPGDGGLANSLKNATSFAHGSCGLHFIIYHEDNNQRALDITVKDANGQVVGIASKVNATPPTKPNPISGSLPGEVSYYISEEVQGHNADVIQFSYNPPDGTQAWNSTSGNCQVGLFDGTGNDVSGDCGFTC